MTGTFRCRGEICQPCGNAAEQIQCTAGTSWGDRIDQLAEPARACVREYLRGIYQRGQVIAKMKEKSQ